MAGVPTGTSTGTPNSTSGKEPMVLSALKPTFCEQHDQVCDLVLTARREDKDDFPVVTSVASHVVGGRAILMLRLTYISVSSYRRNWGPEL